MTVVKTIVALKDPSQRKHLAATIDGLGNYRVVACTSDLMSTYAEVETNLPKVVLLDETFSRAPEFEVMRAMFDAYDVRWLIVNQPREPERRKSARRIAAADLFAVPATIEADQLQALLRSLTRSARRPPSGQAAATPVNHARKAQGLVLIGASTGGVDALVTILRQFPADCPPTVIIQHTSSGFGKSLASLLDRNCAAKVTLAQDDVELRTGSVIIGAGTSTHLRFSSFSPLQVAPSSAPAQNGHRPSVDVLFQSAIAAASRSVAIVLTGMGTDGAKGMQALRQAGAFCIAQDENSSVVYGMPRAAVDLGAVDAVLPLDRIAEAALDAARTRPRSGRELRA